MKDRIIYKNMDGSIAIIVPTQEYLNIFGLMNIALKDVPSPIKNEAGEIIYKHPFWLVDSKDIPDDRTFRDIWEFNTSINPDGYGSEHNTFEGVIS